MNIELIKEETTAQPITSPPADPLLLQNLELSTPQRKKRWNTSIEVEYDPIKDLFVDANTKAPIFALLDADEEEAYFDEDTEVDPLEFESDNSDWIKRGGGGNLKLEELLGIQSPRRLRVHEKAKALK